MTTTYPARWLCGLLATALLLTVRPAPAQNAPPKYGKVSAAELSAAPYAADSGAAAVVLADVGRVYFETHENRFSLKFERTRRVKILDARGFDYATVRIPLYRENSVEERVMGLKAATYRLGAGGKVEKTELAPAGIVTEQLDAHHLERRFTLPAVQAGSVIEYTYTVASFFIFNLQDWWFQEEIPVRWSELRVQIPEYLKYTNHLTGLAPLQITTQETSTGTFTFRPAATSVAYGRAAAATPEATIVAVEDYRWVGVNMPAFRSEPFIAAPSDYLTHVRFQLEGTQFPDQAYQYYTTNWQATNRLLLDHENFGGYLGTAGSLAPKARELRTSEPDPARRAAAVALLVSQNVAFDGADRLYTTQSARKVLELKRGNSAEVNLLLVSALREAGLTANPVIMSTRPHGRIHDDLPLLERFNFVLAAVALPAAPPLLLDATDPVAPPGQVPTRCLNVRGRVIAPVEDQQHWLPVLTNHSYAYYTAGTVTLQPTGDAAADLHRELSGYAAQAARRTLLADGETAVVTAAAAVSPNAQLQKHTLSDQQALDKSLKLHLTVRLPAEAATDLATQYFSLNQLLLPTLAPLTTPTRQYLLDIGASFTETVRLKIVLPEGYLPETVPVPVNLTLPNGAASFQLVYQPDAANKQIEVLSRLVLNNPSYTPQEYVGLRALYEQLLAKYAEPIILKRKS